MTDVQTCDYVDNSFAFRPTCDARAHFAILDLDGEGRWEETTYACKRHLARMIRQQAHVIPLRVSAPIDADPGDV